MYKRQVQTVADEKLAFPILIGRPSVIEMRIKKFGLRLVAGQHFEIVDPEDDSRFNETWTAYYQLKGREGVTPAIAKAMIRKHNTLIGAMLLRRGDADALLCGVASKYDKQLKYIDEIIGKKEGQTYAALNVLMLPDQTLFVTDTHVNENPSAEEVANLSRIHISPRGGATPAASPGARTAPPPARTPPVPGTKRCARIPRPRSPAAHRCRRRR